MKTLALSSAGIYTASALGGCRSIFAPGKSEAFRWVDGIEPRTMAVVGDIQRADENSFILGTVLGHTSNDAERTEIVNHIATSQPDMVLMLGDMVSDGSSVEDWEYFDRATFPIRDMGIPTLSILGNHDYGSLQGPSTEQPWRMNFCNRFPHQSEALHGVTRMGNFALVRVDSNHPILSASPFWKEQKQWYDETLRELDADPSIDGVIVASHHPPYTNGGFGYKNNGQSTTVMMEDVRNAFADQFQESKKTRLYLSGHVHSYQRFNGGKKSDPKTFVISGGGGGTLHPVRLSRSLVRPEADFHNLIKEEALSEYIKKFPELKEAGSLKKMERRSFHYLHLTFLEKTIHVETRMLFKSNEGEWGIVPVDWFSV